MAIAVIPCVEPQDVRDRSGRLVIRKGEKTVSHGVDLDTGRNITLPCDPWNEFVRHHCRYDKQAAEWVLKD